MEYNVALCTGADYTVGMGHAIRSSGLLSQLKLNFNLYVLGKGNSLAQFFPKSICIEIADWSEFAWDAIEIPPLDIVLVDMPFYYDVNWPSLRILGTPLLVIDDHGGYKPADIIINGTVLSEYHNYDERCNPTAIYKGPMYSLIRPEFASKPWQGIDSNTVTILVGSGVESRDWIMAIARIGASQFDAGIVQIVVGRLFDGINELEGICREGRFKLHIGVGAASLAEMFSSSAVALVTAGTGLYEAVASGIPVVSFPQIQDLVKESAWFSQRGACLDLTIDCPEPKDAALAVNYLLNDRNASILMNKCQSKCLDGRGMVRAANIIEDILLDKKK